MGEIRITLIRWALKLFLYTFLPHERRKNFQIKRLMWLNLLEFNNFFFFLVVLSLFCRVPFHSSIRFCFRRTINNSRIWPLSENDNNQDYVNRWVLIYFLGFSVFAVCFIFIFFFFFSPPLIRTFSQAKKNQLYDHFSDWGAFDSKLSIVRCGKGCF